MTIDYGTIISGAARTDNIASGGIPIDMEATTHLLDPNEYVFLSLLRAIGGDNERTNMKAEYRERRLIPNWTVTTAAAAAGATSVTLRDYSYVHNDHLLWFPRTNQLMIVQDASIDSTVDVVKASAGTGGFDSAILNGDKVVILNEAHAEGEAIPSAFTNNSIDKYDYLMQTDRIVECTDIEEAIQHYDPMEKRDADRRAAFIEYQRDRNVLYYVGQNYREIVSASGRRRHCMGGFFQKCTENVHDLADVNGVFTLQLLSVIMGGTKFHGASGMTKVGLFGTALWNQISAWPEDKLRVSPNVGKYGVGEIPQILTGYGPLDCAFDPILSADRGLEDRGIIMDPGHIKSLYLRTQKVRMLENITNANEIHAIRDAITGTYGMQLKFEELHAQIKGAK